MKAVSSALPAWLVQRLSALYMLIFLVYVLSDWALARPAGYEAWRTWVISAPVRLPGVVFFVALLLHAWVGLRDIVLDYIHPLPLRLAALMLIAGGLAATALALAPVLGGP